MVIGDRMLVKFGNEQERKKCLVFSGTAGEAWTFVCCRGYDHTRRSMWGCDNVGGLANT